ncbi:MAG: hypothetical protein LBR98_06040 [Syntrophomonadaceae bacterium]|nr:hypothetical protein [Syntrophomonadaceae bacterium]
MPRLSACGQLSAEHPRRLDSALARWSASYGLIYELTIEKRSSSFALTTIAAVKSIWTEAELYSNNTFFLLAGLVILSISSSKTSLFKKSQSPASHLSIS